MEFYNLKREGVVCVRNCEGFLAEYYLSMSYHALQLSYLKHFAE